ncbi:MAG: electron transfer flavoprotein alpha subunit, partial [Kiritimatiellia bacterium]
MSVLLLAEVNNGELSLDATSKAVTAAKLMGDVTILCAGASASAAGAEAATIDGVSKVLVAEDASLG